MRASLATAFSATLFTSALATPVLVERQSFPTTTTYDDGNSAVQFDEGGWTHLTNQGSQWKNGTESYTDNPSGCVSLFRRGCHKLRLTDFSPLDAQSIPRRMALCLRGIGPDVWSTDVCGLGTLRENSQKLTEASFSWSGRKDDRGDFEVYTYNYTDPTVETSIGYGNAYAAFAEEPTSSEVVFEIHE